MMNIKSISHNCYDNYKHMAKFFGKDGDTSYVGEFIIDIFRSYILINDETINEKIGYDGDYEVVGNAPKYYIIDHLQSIPDIDTIVDSIRNKKETIH